MLLVTNVLLGLYIESGLCYLCLWFEMFVRFSVYCAYMVVPIQMVCVCVCCVVTYGANSEMDGSWQADSVVQ